jgi:hypothetical protein
MEIYAGGNRSSKVSRRGPVNRYAGDDMRWCPASHIGLSASGYPREPGLQVDDFAIRF